MKLLFVITNLAGGGAERVLCVVASELAKRHDVTILKFDEDAPAYELNPKITLINADYKKQKAGILRNLSRQFKKLKFQRNFMKNHKFDAIISFCDTTNIITFIANIGLKNRLIMTEHNEQQIPPFILRSVRDICYKFSDMVTVLNRDDYNHYCKFTNCQIMHNPFFGNPPLISEIKKENIVFTAGRLVPQKNHKMLLNAINLLPRNLQKEWKFIIAGSGPLENELKNLANNLNIDVNFIGFQSDISSWYKKAKIFVLSSDYDGFGNVLVESAFYDCVRLSTAVGGAKELIVDGKNGLLSTIDDANEFAGKLELLMRDEELRENLIKNARESLDEFLPENIANRWEKLIEKVIKS